ncbi:hypothetical protein RJG79_03265 [Mycoplasmatota bacterium WC44]
MNNYDILENHNFDQIIKEYKKQISDRSKRASRIIKLLIVLYLVIMAVLILISPGILKGGAGTVSYCIFGGIVGVVLFVGLLISIYSSSEKPFHTLVMKEMVDYINITRDSNLEYIAYPKKQHFVNKTGGLFTRGASSDVINKIIGKTDDYNTFSWYNMRLFTSDGKNQYTVFSGMYFVIEYSVGRVFQIRSHSKPHLKGVKFKRIDVDDPLRVFVEDGDITSYVDDRFIKLVSDMKSRFNAKKIFLSSVDNQIHFAFENDEKLRKPKEMTKEVLTETVKKINSVVSVANDIVKVIKQ